MRTFITSVAALVVGNIIFWFFIHPNWPKHSPSTISETKREQSVIHKKPSSPIVQAAPIVPLSKSQQPPPGSSIIGTHTTKRGANAVLPHKFIARVSSELGMEDREGWVNYELQVGKIPFSDLYFVQFFLPSFPHTRELYIIINGHQSTLEVNSGQNVAHAYSWEIKNPEPNGKIRVSLKGKDWKLPPLEGFIVLYHK